MSTIPTTTMKRDLEKDFKKLEAIKQRRQVSIRHL